MTQPEKTKEQSRLKGGLVKVTNPYTKRLCDILIFPALLLGVAGSFLLDSAVPIFISLCYLFLALFVGMFISAFAKQDEGITAFFPFDECVASQGKLLFINKKDRFELSWNPTPGGRMSNRLQIVAGAKNQFEFRFRWFKNQLAQLFFLCPGLVGHEVVKVTKEMYRPEMRVFMEDEEFLKLFPKGVEV